MTRRFTLTCKVEIFPQKGGWVFVRVPKKYTDMTARAAHWGLVPITATVGKTSWDTSLLPMGDGTHFIALNAKVRKAENISVGGTVKISFRLRKLEKVPNFFELGGYLHDKIDPAKRTIDPATARDDMQKHYERI